MKYLLSYFSVSKKAKSLIPLLLISFLLFILMPLKNNSFPISPLPTTKAEAKNNYEVFGFAPYWNLNKLDNIDFNVLTTLAYFGFSVDYDGNFDTSDPGYQAFDSKKAKELFANAHSHGTRVVLTVTQMDNDLITSFLDNPAGQENAIDNIVSEVTANKLDGVNVDFEYLGNPGDVYKEKFSAFVKRLTDKMHKKLPGSYVTVSVYASAVKDPKIYDIASLSKASDAIFMMAYDFATAGSDNVIPTSPLYGYKDGKYWYDVSSAVDDFLTQMPKEKLILGLPWYGYDYPVNSPEVKAETDSGYYSYYWYRGRQYYQFIARPGAYASTYSTAVAGPAQAEGWDDEGEVGWRAYQSADGWRMLFLDDVKSLGIKYDFAKDKGLGGVGVWALGFDQGKDDMWQLLNSKFGKKLVDARSQNKTT